MAFQIGTPGPAAGLPLTVADVVELVSVILRTAGRLMYMLPNW